MNRIKQLFIILLCITLTFSTIIIKQTPIIEAFGHYTEDCDTI